MEKRLEQEAVLVYYASRKWPGVKGAKEADEALQEKLGTAKGSTRTTKYLVDPDELSENSKFFNAAYSFFKSNTLPWQDGRGAPRLLTGKRYAFFKDGMDALIQAAMDRADEFTKKYPSLIEQWRPRLSGIFDLNDYPANFEIRDHFTINVRAVPLPLSPASLTLRFLGADELRAMKADLENQWREQEKIAMADLYNRLLEPVAAMVERLSDPEKRFKNSLVDNLSEVCNLLPELNFTDDPELDALVNTIRDKLTKIDPDTLRINKRVRKQVADEASSILEKITGVSGRYIARETPQEPQEEEDMDDATTGRTTPEPGNDPAPYQAAAPAPGTTPALW